MKKIIPFIVIVITILQLFAPFSVVLNGKNNIEINKNIAEARYPTLKLNVFTKIINTNSVEITTDIILGKYGISDTKEGVKITLTNLSTKKSETKEVDLDGSAWFKNQEQNFTQKGSVIFNNLDPNGNYVIKSTLRQFDVASFHFDTEKTLLILSDLWGISEEDWGMLKSDSAGSEVTITTYIDKLVIKQENGDVIADGRQQEMSETGYLPACNISNERGGTFMGCIAQVLYYLFFKTTSFFFGLSGKALDFTLMYSLSDNSYRSDFIVQGWELVRDFCNMFFIFILLYVAFGTILNLNGVKTKEMIINVVIVGLLINFSLFATRLIIDTSNILARVFYNQESISVGEVARDNEGNIVSEKNELGDLGEIRLSEAIISKVDPQKIITESAKIDSIKTKGGMANEDSTKTDQGITTGSFILIIFLTTIVNIVGFVSFVSCALIFIGRVVSLWVAMIIVPIAFFTYIVPELKKTDMVGWSSWWSNTLKAAFVAPVFTFFMYIIVGFASKGFDIIDASNKSGLNFVVAIIVPFIFIMVLLMKAKKIAVDMSGEIGSLLSKAGSSISSLALGAATGGAAFLGRASIGKMGSKIAESDWAKRMANSDNKLVKSIGNKSIDTGTYIGKKSFDVRNTKLGGEINKGLDVDMGKGKEGGFIGRQEEKAKRDLNRIERGKQSSSEALEQDKKAKEYNDKYQKNMVLAKEAADRSGVSFDEDLFRSRYEASNRKIKDSKTIEQERMKKIADEMERKWDGSSSQASIIKEIQTKGKPEKAPLTPLEEYDAKKAIEKANQSIIKAQEASTYADNELRDIDNDMRTLISAVSSGALNTADVKKDDIKFEVDNRQTNIITQEANIVKETAALTKDPNDITALTKLKDANMEKNKLMNEIGKLNSMLNNKQKNNESKVQQSNLINQQNNIINQQNNIIARR